MLLGYDIHKLPILPTKTSPWEITVLTDGKPLPRNMDPTQRVRRLTYAKRYAKATSSLPLSEHVIYTDAALPTDGTSNTCYATAWYDQTNGNQNRHYHVSTEAVYSTRAELVAILDYLEWALETASETDRIHHRVYTDSQAAYRSCTNVHYTDPVLQKIRHQARLLRDCAELADPMADKHIAKQRRAAYLTAVGNPLSIPSIPSKVFTRREGGTPLPVSGFCSTCNCRADLNHLCWECPLYIPARLRALATINRGPWPSSLRTWACPDPTRPDRAIEFWRALLMFLQDPAAPPVGDRLRDNHKIQAAPT
ncbi:hypothetical protein HPB50_021188 [Hyalomma asiaticum]|uniref:Uncharacterized protein n=1 Tax=Hyalomma asiaticum TaxID=266040 RepID=A0ACB7RZ36_HYAAI|nr:hypothetical protein HPB50_021188 [Hyalomma asiaticum]